MRWRLLVSEITDPIRNLATEEAIVRCRTKDVCPDTLRVWRNDASVVLGCNSIVGNEVDLQACRRMGVNVLRRTSGGGAVYHDLGNLNYSIILKETHTDREPDIQDVYERFAKAVTSGLKRLDVKTEFCKPNSILLNGRKISGMAQHRFYDVLLLHGTLLVNSDLQALSSVLLRPKQEVTSISRELDCHVPIRAVEKAIVYGFRKLIRSRFHTSGLTIGESRMIEELIATKYETERWNLHIDEELCVDEFLTIPTVELPMSSTAEQPFLGDFSLHSLEPNLESNKKDGECTL
jgi:lipoate-protein ligase A